MLNTHEGRHNDIMICPREHPSPATYLPIRVPKEMDGHSNFEKSFTKGLFMQVWAEPENATLRGAYRGRHLLYLKEHGRG